MNIILQRSITGGIYIFIIIVSLLVHPLAFALVASMLNYLGLSEIYNLFRPPDKYNSKIWIHANGILTGTSLILMSLGTYPYFILPLVFLLILQLILPLYNTKGDIKSNLLVPVFGFVFLSLPLVLLTFLQIRAVEIGLPLMLAVFIFIWTNDTFAYLSGMAFGRHRLFERISPKKSWEGLFGGTIMGGIAALCFFYLYPERGILFWLSLSIITSIAAVFGDFVESYLKRSTGVKDSGTLLPGHGGILDRIDSVLLVSPVIYFYLILVLNN